MDLWTEHDQGLTPEQRKRFRKHGCGHRHDYLEQPEEYERYQRRTGIEFGQRARIGSQRVISVRATEL
mgnify:FL=1